MKNKYIICKLSDNRSVLIDIDNISTVLYSPGESEYGDTVITLKQDERVRDITIQDSFEDICLFLQKNV